VLGKRGKEIPTNKSYVRVQYYVDVLVYNDMHILFKLLDNTDINFNQMMNIINSSIRGYRIFWGEI